MSYRLIKVIKTFLLHIKTQNRKNYAGELLERSHKWAPNRASPDAGTPTFSDSLMPVRLTIDFAGARRANKAGAFGVYQRAPRLTATRFTIENDIGPCVKRSSQCSV
jgi:hypothetical protein